MALVVEDGTGKADAESYLSAADATTYLTAVGSAAAWGVDAALQEAALRRATQYIDGEYGRRFYGYRATQNQALQWPRWDAYDADGYLIPTGQVPTALKHATAEAALRERVTPGILTPDLVRGGAVDQKTVTAGPVSVSTTYSESASVRTLFPVLDNLLARYITSGMNVRLVRA